MAPAWCKHKIVYSWLRFTKVCLKPGAVKGGGSTIQCGRSAALVSGSGAADVSPVAFVFAVNDNASVLVNCHIPNTSGTSIKRPSAAKKVQNWGKNPFPYLPVLVNSCDPLILIKFSGFVSSIALLYIQPRMYTDTHIHMLWALWIVPTMFLLYSNPIHIFSPERLSHSAKPAFARTGRGRYSVSHSWEGAGGKRGGKALPAFLLCPGVVPNKDCSAER